MTQIDRPSTAQFRMARAALRLRIAQAADLCNVTPSMIIRFEGRTEGGISDHMIERGVKGYTSQGIKFSKLGDEETVTIPEGLY